MSAEKNVFLLTPEIQVLYAIISGGAWCGDGLGSYEFHCFFWNI
jgi:hypothetical protein